jgi:hypothetical protein
MLDTVNDPDRQSRVLLGFLVVVGMALAVIAWLQVLW